MADELSLTASIVFTKSTVRQSKTVNETLIDVGGNKYVSGVQAIGNAAEALTLGGLTSLGYCMLKNLDATNYIEVRDGADGADVVKLLAGDVAIFRLATNAPYAISNSSADLEYLILEA